MRKLFWFGGALVCGYVGCSGTLIYYQRHVSVLFPGEPKIFEQQYDKQFGLPVTSIMPLLGEGVATQLILKPSLDKIGFGSLALQKAKNAFEKLIAKAPDCFIGYTALAWYYVQMNDVDNAKLWLQKSEEVAEQNPEWKEKFDFLLPDEYFLCPNEAPTNPSMLIEAGDDIWRVWAPFELHGRSFMVQSSVVRLLDGSLVIINPTGFNDEMKESIDKLGNVKYIITTTSPHGAAVRDAHTLWPDAYLFGTDTATKHDQPGVPWNGFFTPKGFQATEKTSADFSDLEAEFKVLHLSGHLFKEATFYHERTKNLLGLTDMMIFVDEAQKENLHTPWLFGAYMFALGLYRPDIESPISTQSYHLMFVTDRLRLVAAMKEIQGLDVDQIILGHGGVVQGKEECQSALTVGFRWATNTQPSPLESIMSKVLWRGAYRIPF